MSLFYMYFLHYSLVYSSALSFTQFSAITKLNGTNYKQWVKSLMMNLTIMKLNMTLKVDAPPKPLLRVLQRRKSPLRGYSNSCCLMIMENHLEYSIYKRIPKIENTKEFLDAVGRKYIEFSKNEKY